MTVDPADAVVIIPDKYGFLSVCTAADFVARLEDGESLDDAISNSGIDSIEPTGEQFRRIYQLNATGDADAFWNAEG